MTERNGKKLLTAALALFLPLAALTAFVGVNGHRLAFTNDEAYDVIHDIASGAIDEVADIAARLRLESLGRMAW